MNIVQRHDQINARWGGLPAVDATASFNFFDQSIVFSSFSKKDIDNIKKTSKACGRFEKIAEIYRIACHEYRHWIDITSSTYGLSWLKQLNDIRKLKHPTAIKNQSAEDLCSTAWQFATEIHLPDYYSVIEGFHKTRPWRYTTTVGRAFTRNGKLSEKHPIWFLRFSDAKDRPIARQPITIASLLEARAVEAELAATARIVLKTNRSTSEEKLAAQQQMTQETIRRVYSPALTLYSAAAHWHANNRGNSDIADAYLGASRLARFCLNAPSEWLSGICSTQAFEKLMGSQATELMNHSLRRKDRAALFYMLACDTRLSDSKNFDRELNEILEEWNTNSSTLDESSALERRNIFSSLLDNAPAILHPFLQALLHNQQENVVHTDIESFPALRLPAVILKDTCLLNPFTLDTGSDAISGNFFDPQPHAEVFYELQEDIYSCKVRELKEPHHFSSE